MVIFKAVLIGLVILCGLYIAMSWVLLDGRVTYWTSFNETFIEDSKKKELFITDSLLISTFGDSVKNWKDKFEVWTNQRFERKYFGILFYRTYTKPEWRYLNIKFKQWGYEYDNDWCIDRHEAHLESCCNFKACQVGDMITMDFVKCKDKMKLGSMTVFIR